MGWYLNDISLAGQYPTPAAFVAHLKQLLEVRSQVPQLAANLSCSRSLHLRPVAPSYDFQQAVRSAGDRGLTHIVLSWLSKSGPFWEDTRHAIADDYFECHHTDVTDQGLGEAARRHLSGMPTNSFSFSGAGFDYSPLVVLHGLPEAPYGTADIPNHWLITELRRAIEAATPPALNWGQMLDLAQMRFKYLALVPACINALKAEPFSRYVVERTFELLGVLDEYVGCLANGQAERAHELLALHFGGEKAWFSDESDTNKRKFRDQLAFVDPERPDTKVFCPWHGKVKTPQYRIHFEWPPQAGEKLRIFYIGPKITKA